jgi:hypothetical protein
MSAPIWQRPPRCDRYRLKSDFNHAADAWQSMTGKTSASYGDLIALARLGAEVRILREDGIMMRMMHDGSLEAGS